MALPAVNEDPEAGPRATRVVEQVRDLILRGALQPREQLRQAALAERLGVSKIPVREALQQLYAEGLLSHDHNRGYFVAPLHREEAEQLYRLRRWIEAELLRTVRWPEAAELADLGRQVQALARTQSSSGRAAWMRSLNALRESIFGLSASRTLLREAARLWRLTDRYRAIMPADYGSLCERELVQALAARDRSQLLDAYHADRDRIEASLRDALAHLPGIEELTR